MEPTDAALDGHDANPEGAASDDAGAGDAALTGPCGERVELSAFEAELRFQSLARLCEAVAKVVACPRDLVTYTADLAPKCAVDNHFPELRPGCGLVGASQRAEGRHFSTWYFDVDSGALVGARVVVLSSTGCGPGTYVAGEDNRACTNPQPACPLCLSVPDRDTLCPTAVVEAAPATACEPRASTPDCRCDAETFEELPAAGTPCGECDHCQHGTCWASCVCALDGVWRWQQECTD